MQVINVDLIDHLYGHTQSKATIVPKGKVMDALEIPVRAGMRDCTIRIEFTPALRGDVDE